MTTIRFCKLTMLWLVVMAACTTSDLRKGAVALELGDYTMAINFFSRVLERKPAHFEARLGMGKALLQQAIDDAEGEYQGHHGTLVQALLPLSALEPLAERPDVAVIREARQIGE